MKTFWTSTPILFLVSLLLSGLSGPAYRGPQRPLQAPNMTISMGATPEPAVAGGQITYTISIDNDDPATGVIVTDTLPTQVTLVSATPSIGTCGTTNPVVCDIGSLGTNADPTITILVNVIQAGIYQNSARMVAATGDSNQNNNNASFTSHAGPYADLSISKTGPLTSPVVGQPFSYTITVDNHGLTNATNVTVTDDLPAGVALISVTPSQGVSCPLADPVVCNLGAIAYPGSASVTIVVQAPADGTVNNTATVTSDLLDPVPGDNTDTVSVNVLPAADLEIVKTGPITPPVVGQQFSYTLQVINHGPDAAAGVTVTDDLPPQVSRASATPTQGSCQAGDPVICNLGPIAYPGSASVTIVVNTLADGMFGNTAGVDATTTDLVPGNDSDTANVTVLPAADLRVTKTGPGTSPVVGQQFSYTILVENLGPDLAAGVTVTDDLNSNLARVSATPTQGSCAAGDPVVCSLGPIASGGNATVTIVVNALNDVTFDNTATVSSTTADLAAGNNSDTVSTTVLPAADLSITKIDNVTGSFYVGQQFSYTIQVTNHGPDTATGVAVSDPLPAQVARVSVTTTRGTCGSGSTVNCALGDLLDGQSATITIVVRALSTGSITNTATVDALTDDLIPGNDSANETTPVLPSADLAVTKTASVSAQAPGGSVTYTIVVTNHGPSPAVDVTLADDMPPLTVFPSPVVSAPPGVLCSTPGPDFTCDLNTMGVGQTATITVVDQVPEGAPEITVTNTASVSSTGASPTHDPLPTNNTAAVQTVISDSLADLQILQIDDSPDPVVAGSPLAYQIQIQNDGPSTASGVVVTSTLPAGVSFVSALFQGGSCTGANPVVCTRGNLPSGGGATVTILVNTGVGTAGPVALSAIAGSAAPDSNTANNTASATTTVRREADLVIAKAGSASPVIAGDNLVYTLDVTNQGPSLGAGVRVTDTLPAGTTFVSFSQGGSLCGASAGVMTCALGNLNPSASRRIVYTVRVNSGTANGSSLHNAAEVASGTTQYDDDPVLVNNTVVVNTPVITQANLSLAIADAPDPVKGGANLVFTLSATNGGPSNALSVEINNTLPGGVSLQAFPSGSPCQKANQAGTQVKCTLGTLNAGETRQVTIPVRVNVTSGSLLNSASLSSATTDPPPANHGAQSTTTVDSQAPQVAWVLPVGDGKEYFPGPLVQLVVNATDNLAVDRVVFARWAPDSKGWVIFHTDNTAPYSVKINTDQFPIGWSQIGVVAYDRAGNASGSFTTNIVKYIFIYVAKRYVFSPLILR